VDADSIGKIVNSSRLVKNRFSFVNDLRYLREVPTDIPSGDTCRTDIDKIFSAPHNQLSHVHVVREVYESDADFE
jgi:hypothetical protein